MATLIGKLLFVFILVCSLLFAGMALGLYTNRINWPGTTQAGVSPETQQGELGKKIEEVKRLKEAFERSRKRWQMTRSDLYVEEEARPRLLRWYAEQIQIHKTGKDLDDKEAPNPVKSLVYQDGALKLGKNGYPATENLEVPHLGALERQIMETEDDIARVTREIGEEIKKQKNLTEQIKEERVLIGEEEQALKNAQAQLKYLAPFLYNYEVDSQTLLKRQRLMEGRLRELEPAAAARKQ